MTRAMPTSKQAEYVAKAPPLYQGVFGKAFTGDSRVAAIKAKCLTCSNFQRVEVAECTVLTCPLHSVRPYQKGDKDRPSDEEKAAESGHPDAALETSSKIDCRTHHAPAEARHGDDHPKSIPEHPCTSTRWRPL